MNTPDTINAIKIVTDSITITLDEIDFLTKRKCNKIKTDLRNVPFAQGALCWSVYCIPCYDKDYVSVYLNVTAPTNVKGTWNIGNSAILENFEYRYEFPGIMGNNKFVHHKYIIPYFVDKKISITCRDWQ
uniref:MATH domain-containing protein n=1 Tax=Panagrellus redivivus TaxID=6233 RepID=A0A7E4WE29_PANRE